MIISSLRLLHFRNYTDQRLTFDPEMNLFWGPNGQGKTNLLEALYYLTICKSHRNSIDADLISFEADYFRLEGQFRTRYYGQVQVEISYSKPRGKVVKINGRRLDRISELMQMLAAVELSPEDISLTKGSPSVRRQFIDITISQTNAAYLHALQEYRNVLSQRNELLRKYPPAKASHFEVWDEQLIQWGSKIIQRRLAFIKNLRERVNQLYQTLSQDIAPVELIYEPFSLSHEASLEAIQQAFAAALRSRFKREQKYKTTSTGPHRDDVTVLFDDLELRRFGSQGQHRLVSTALRLSQALYLKDENDDCPLVLFDDVFAELDDHHKGLLEEMMSEFEQVFVATPRSTELNKTRQKAKIFYIKGGTVHVQ